MSNDCTIGNHLTQNRHDLISSIKDTHIKTIFPQVVSGFFHPKADGTCEILIHNNTIPSIIM